MHILNGITAHWRGLGGALIFFEHGKGEFVIEQSPFLINMEEVLVNYGD